MSRKIYQCGLALCVAESFDDAARIMGVAPGRGGQVFDITPGLKVLCESVLGPDTFAPPHKPVFFSADAPSRAHRYALGAVGVVTGDKEAIDEVARLVKLDVDHDEQSTWLHDELAAAKARIAELEAAAKETNDRLVWQAETRAQALDTPSPVPVTIEATPLAPLPITDPTPAQDEWAHLDRILREDWPGDVPFATIRDTVARAGYVMNDQAIRNRAVKLGLRRTNPTALQAQKSPSSPRSGEVSAKPTEGYLPSPSQPETLAKGDKPSRLAKLIGAEAIRLRDELLNPDEIAQALNTSLSRNDHVTARQVTQVLAEMQRLQRAHSFTE